MIQHICKNIYHVSINPRVFHVESSEQFLVGELGIGLMLLPAADSVIGKSTKSFKTGVPQINMQSTCPETELWCILFFPKVKELTAKLPSIYPQSRFMHIQPRHQHTFTSHE